MVKKILVSSFTILLLSCGTSHATKEVPYTPDDRDRLIRLETKVDEGLRAVNQRIDSIEKRIDSVEKQIESLQQLIYVLIGAVMAQTIGVIGFVLWDRRTAVSPVVRKSRELEDREDRIEKALRELAKEDEKVARALKTATLL